MSELCSVRVVFLDFDGVLNSHDYMLHRAPESERGSVMGLDAEAIARLNRLLREAEAVAVVSSTWRHNRTVAQLQDVLVARGFVGTVIGMTPRWLKEAPSGPYAGERRGHEIQAWLNDAPNYGVDVRAFVIVDDDSDMAHLADRLVKIPFETGLLDEHVDRAVAMLREPPPLIVVPSRAVRSGSSS